MIASARPGTRRPLGTRAAAFVLLASLAASSAAAAPRDCVPAVAASFSVCLGRAADAIGRCTAADVEDCAADPDAVRVADQLRRKVTKRCSEFALRLARFPPPFDPPTVAARFADACLADASLLARRSVEVAGPPAESGCAAKLLATSTRLARRTLDLTAACALAGSRCDPVRTARRIAQAREQAGRAVVKRCRDAGLTAGSLDAVLARVATQMGCALGRVVPSSPPCAPSGAEALVDLWSLPAPRPPGTQVAQVSSYDRSGGNADLGVGPDTAPLLAAFGLPAVELDNSYLYRDGDRYVIFDELGPGVVWRLWMTGLDGLLLGDLAGDVQFEVDDEGAPRLVLDRKALFAGATAPFLTPLAGDRTVSSGGYYSMVPIAFARRLRISTSTVPNWTQVTFSRLPADQAVTSFQPGADPTATAALLVQAGAAATTVTPTWTDVVGIAVEAGAETTLWQREGSGTVVRLELVGPAGADLPVDLRFRARFDGIAPQIDVPLDDLFGASLGPGARSMAFGRDGDRFYFYFPMPFDDGVRFSVRNEGESAFAGWQLRVGGVDTHPPGAPTRLHAVAAVAHPVPDDADYVLLDTTGAGHVVGVVMTAGCGAAGACQLANLPGIDGAHLEGDERIQVDGSRWPQIHGTGLEDFFSGGFYFIAGPFALPTHGNPAQEPETSPRRPGRNLRSTYRLLLGDAIPFGNGIRLAIEHGPENDVPAQMSSVVFFYRQQTGRLAERDRLTIGDARSELVHGLVTTERSDVSLTSAFRGDASDEPSTATGMTARSTRFRLAVDPANLGVRLRRLADLAAGEQAALVVIDGVAAGVWRTTEVNPLLRWADLEFELPPALTAGRTAIEVEIDASDSPSPWTAFEYVALSHLP